jgi:hypothetical protein
MKLLVIGMVRNAVCSQFVNIAIFPKVKRNAILRTMQVRQNACGMLMATPSSAGKLRTTIIVLIGHGGLIFVMVHPNAIMIMRYLMEMAVVWVFRKSELVVALEVMQNRYC